MVSGDGPEQHNVPNNSKGVQRIMHKLPFYCIRCVEMLVMNPYIVNTLSNDYGFYAFVASEGCIELASLLYTTF